MNTKLRIKMGAVEVEYEGSDDFLKKELPELLKGVLELHTKAGVEGDGGVVGVSEKGRRAAVKIVSPSTVAVKLKATSGSELALAAAAALSIGERKDSFSRAELLAAMQMAKAHYRKTYSSNLTSAISTLVKSGALLDQGSNSYALSDSKKTELEKTLAEG